MQKGSIRIDKNIFKIYIKFILIVYVCIFCDVNSLLSQVDTYFPVKVGNTWTYNEIIDIYLYGKQTITIVDTIAIEGRRYFLFDRFFYAGKFKDSSLFRFEDQKVIRNVGGVEQVWFDFDVAVNDFWFLEIFDPDLDTTVQVKVTLFSKNINQNINGRNINDCYCFYFKILYATEHDWSYTLAKDIGCVVMWSGGSVPVYYKFREGTINGVEYPDLVSKINEKPEHNINLKNGSKILSVYPNPFNLETQFRFHITEECHVTLSIFNLLGQKLWSLIDKQMATGYHTIKWDGRDDVGNTVTSGVYLYVIQASKFFDVKKMVLLQ